MSESAEGAPSPLLAPLLVAAYVACIAAAGALANCSLLASLLKPSTNGLFFILLQLSMADIALGASISLEIWSYNTKNWMLGNCSCVAYRGLSVLASTASAYLVATVSLHTLATVNLEEQSISRSSRKNNQDEDDEIRSSRHSLVASASSDSSTPPRTMNVDYRVSAGRVSIIQPTVFVWILAVSLSVPDFALAALVYPSQNVVLCTIVDTSQRIHLYSILALFNLFVPIIIMCIAGVMVILKLKSITRKLQLDKGDDSKATLNLSLGLIVVYFMACVPRSFLLGYNVYLMALKGESTFIESVRPDETSISIGLAFSCVYLSSIVIRPLFCIFCLPSARKAFTYGHG